MRTFWVIGFLIMVLLWPPQADAAPLCKTVNTHQVCILKITRSAKHHWEYRAAVSIDGQPRPTQIYDCRHRSKTPEKKKPVSFEVDIAGTLICSYFHKS